MERDPRDHPDFAFRFFDPIKTELCTHLPTRTLMIPMNPQRDPLKTLFLILTHRLFYVACLWSVVGLRQALAALPTPVPPSTSPAAGNWLALIEGYIKDGGLVLGLAIAVIAFLWVSYVAIAKFNDARTGRAEWAEVGLTGVVAAGVLVFIGFLINEAANVIP